MKWKWDANLTEFEGPRGDKDLGFARAASGVREQIDLVGKM